MPGNEFPNLVDRHIWCFASDKSADSVAVFFGFTYGQVLRLAGLAVILVMVRQTHEHQIIKGRVLVVLVKMRDLTLFDLRVSIQTKAEPASPSATQQNVVTVLGFDLESRGCHLEYLFVCGIGMLQYMPVDLQACADAFSSEKLVRLTSKL